MNQGDIYHVDLDPTKGQEQQGKRYVLIVSPAKFNNAFRLALVCPITMGGETARSAGFAVHLVNLKTNGYVLCNQARVIDVKARGGVFHEKVPSDVIEEVLSIVETLLERQR